MDNLTRFEPPVSFSPAAYLPPVPNETERPNTDYFRIARRRWIYIPLFALGLAFLALVISLKLPKTYQSTAEVLVESPQSAASTSVSSSQYAQIAGMLGLSGGNDLATQVEVMTSDAALTEVARQNNIHPPDEDLRHQFTIETSKTSSEILNITAAAGKPKLAANLVRSLVGVYNRTMSQESSTQVGRMAKATHNQLMIVSTNLAKAETQKAEYSKALGSIDPVSETSQKVGQLFTLKSELLKTREDFEVSQAQNNFYQGQMKILDPSVVPNVSYQVNPRIENDKTQLETLEQQRIVLSAQYTPNDDQMINNQKQIDVIKQQMVDELKLPGASLPLTLGDKAGKQTAPSGAYEPTGMSQELNPLREDARSKIAVDQAAIAADSAQEKVLQNYLDSVQADVHSTPDALRKLDDLTANVLALRAIQTQLYSEDQELQARLPAEQAYAQFLTSPLVPKKQIAPRPVLYSALAGLFGLLIGCIVAVLVDNGDNRLRDTKDAETLFGRPLLQSIYGNVSRELSLSADDDLEQYKELAYTLGYLGIGRSIRSILITSAVKDEGATSVASNLAVALSKEGRRVVLIDANVKTPVLHILFGQKNNDGLAGLMRNGAQPDHALLAIGGSSSLSLIPGGDVNAGPEIGDMLDADKFEHILASLKEKADVVIVDAPAVFGGLETSVLADKVDGIIFVSRAGFTTRATVRRAFELLQNCRAQIIGTVLNGAKD